jgi:hypothetical protein
MYQDTPPSHSLLDMRSVLIAVAVLLVGAALGFGVGYKYEKHAKSSSHSASSTHSTTPTTAKPPSASLQAQAKNMLMTCMAGKGVQYPSPSADISKPPAGVAQSTFQAARVACYSELLQSKKKP